MLALASAGLAFAMTVRPKAVIFDLDGCLWYPDMYMIWGGGAPFKVADDGSLLDKKGARVVMLGAVPEILTELNNDPAWSNTVVGIASCTDEPSWAQECLRKFRLADSSLCIKDVITPAAEEIRKANKRTHFKNIAEQTGIALEDMLFFDNEYGNCQDVSSVGVSVCYCPDGVTRGAWDLALEAYPSPGEIIHANW